MSTIGSWVTVFGIVVGAVVTLCVAYLHRKQMRQIELHRVDPNVPVTPPPHAVTLLLKRRWYIWYSVLFGGFDLGMLIRDLSLTSPVTRTVVFDIAMDLTGIFFMALMPVLVSMLNRAGESASKTIDVLIGMTYRIEKLEKSLSPPAKSK